MASNGKTGWDDPVEYETFAEMFGPDKLNEVVNFYFEVTNEDDADEATVSLQLWVLHPRKGCSAGVYIKTITQDALPAVFDFLAKAADRNAERFSKIPRK